MPCFLKNCSQISRPFTKTSFPSPLFLSGWAERSQSWYVFLAMEGVSNWAVWILLFPIIKSAS